MRVEEIYEALHDDDAFARLPDILAASAGARSALLMWQHNDGSCDVLAHSYFSEDFMRAYSSDWGPHDPWIAGAIRAGRPNEVILLDQYVSPREFEHSAFYNEFMREFGDNTFFCTGAMIQSAWGSGVVSVQRGRTDTPFDAEDARRFNATALHVEKVVRARGELAATKRAVSQVNLVLDTVGLATLTVRGNSRIMSANAAADHILHRGDGVISRNSCLGSPDTDSGHAIDQAIAAATRSLAPSASAVLVARMGDLSPYVLTVTPLIGGSGAATALILFRDPDVADASLAPRLRQIFGLTPAEAIVAAELMRGRSLHQIAAVRKASIATLRSQWKAISAKTGCARQSELVALLSSFPALR